jgi:hypothetical protein
VVDPNTAIALASATGAAAAAAKVAHVGPLLERVLGPTADYLGGELQSWVERRLTNVERIAEVAERRLGDRINEQSSIHPRLIREILEDASYFEDEVAVEYFGGVLASSRTGISRDDRGVVFARLVERLSAYQLRAHFLFYRLFKDLMNGRLNTIIGGYAHNLKIFIPSQEFFEAMEFSPDEDHDILTSHIIFGLDREDLIGSEIRWGKKEYIQQDFEKASGEGLLVTPSPWGVELFLWAHGLGDVKVADFLKPTTVIESAIEIDLPKNAVAAREPIPEPPSS